MNMQNLIFKVEGMVCHGCERRIENALLTLNGVKEVKANFNTKEVAITCSKDLSSSVIIAKITDLGFKVLKED